MSNPLARDLDHVVENTRDIWQELRGAHLFITGGTGFFGCWLLESFAWACDRLKLGSDVAVLTRSAAAFRTKVPHLASHPAIRLIEGDVRSFDYPQGHFTHIVHGAADATPKLCQERPLLVLDTIVDGTRHVLEFAVTQGTRRVLFISSGAVYGDQPNDLARLPESYRGAPLVAGSASVYGDAKRTAETLCTVYHQGQGLECAIARCFAFVGPYMPFNAHFAIGNFIQDQTSRRFIRVNGDGTPLRSYMYAADLAIWLWTILVKGVPSRPYNVGSEREITIAETARAVAASLPPAKQVRIASRPIRGAIQDRYVPSTERVRNELNLREWIPLEEAIRRTAAAMFAFAAKGEQA
jgi:nucleoside-diphosphate-sugar epimerase